jgi:hypothetical protein
MTIAESFTRALAARAWRYDVESEVFYGASRRRIEWAEVIGLVPGMTLDELMAWQDAKYDELRQRAAQ